MRLLPAAVLLLTACAVAGCTTVSPARPDATTPPPGRAPAVMTLTPSPAAPLLADVRPDPGTPSATPAPRQGPAAAPRRPVEAVPRAPRPERHRVAGPAAGIQGSGPCAMGRAYGHWPAGSSAATICQGVYGR
ncbi:hypothetical protein [Streptomyces sp. NPDC020983]|uniref:hypothetical protein n=1 Tax=Streptomyces sp. NPDC020983 TaxID=3365106 RepID=UPI00379B4827